MRTSGSFASWHETSLNERHKPMTSDRARQLAQQLVARADVLLHETVQSEGVPPRGRLLDGLGPRGWLTHPAVAVFLIVIVVASVTEAIIPALSNRSPVPPG